MARPSAARVLPKDLVWIVWKDAYGDKRTILDEDLPSITLTTNTSIGWIIHENADRLVLAYETSGTGEREFSVIPVNWIVERIPVRRPRARKEPNENLHVGH